MLQLNLLHFQNILDSFIILKDSPAISHDLSEFFF